MNKMKNKIISGVLSFTAMAVLAVIAMSPKAFAVNATQITIGGTDYILTASLPANMSYNVTTNTLTLTNATITDYVKINGDITIELVGTNTITSTNTVANTVNGALHVMGATTIQGSGSLTATGAHPQDGIYIGLSSTSSESANQALTINKATITATGGTSDAVIGRKGISCGSLKIYNATVTAKGGTTDIDTDKRAGGHGIFVNNGGEIDIKNAEINATGGDGNSNDKGVGVGGAGGAGLYIGDPGSSSDNISDTTMTVSGGDTGTSSVDDGGSGLNFLRDLTLVNCTIKSATGGDTAGTGKAGYGIYLHGTTLTLDNTTITTAKGGAGKSPQGGIVMTSGKLILENGSTINATGGDGTANSAGSGVLGSVTLNHTSKLTATGGNATGAAGTTSTGGHGVIGSVTLNGSSKLTANGGNASGGTTNTAGYGVIGSVTLNSDDIVLSAIGGNTLAHGLSQVAMITPTSTLLDAYVGASGFTTKVDLADSTDPLYLNYYTNRYVYISKGPPPTPTPSQQPQQQPQQPARDVIYPINLSLSNYDRYIFNSSGLYSDFTGVWIHGFAIPASYYTLTMESDGTATVQLKDWYVRTLNYGEEYLIHLVFSNGNTNGYAVTKFYR